MPKADAEPLHFDRSLSTLMIRVFILAGDEISLFFFGSFFCLDEFSNLFIVNVETPNKYDSISRVSRGYQFYSG